MGDEFSVKPEEMPEVGCKHCKHFKNLRPDECWYPGCMNFETSEWFKCSDMMPDCNETVLLYLGNGIITYGRWIEIETPQTWETVRAHDFETGATHWMPLPEPPEDK